MQGSIRNRIKNCELVNYFFENYSFALNEMFLFAHLYDDV